MIVHKKCELNLEQKDFLNFVNSNDFPWFHTIITQYDQQGVMRFAHSLMNRSNIDGNSGQINSPHYEMAYSIFKSFCDSNNVQVKKIFRAAFNLTLNSSKPNAGIHQDHNFPHKVFVMYINECTGDTQLFSDSGDLISSIPPEKNTAVIFNNQPHTHLFPNADGYRIVMVFTFE